MLNALNLIAERRISQAIHEGRLDAPSWKGKPLPTEQDCFIPDDLKMAYKILKNSGYLPPEIKTRKDIHKLEELVNSTDDEHLKVKQIKKLNFLVLKLNTMCNRPINLETEEYYYGKVVDRMSIKSKG